MRTITTGLAAAAIGLGLAGCKPAPANTSASAAPVQSAAAASATPAASATGFQVVISLSPAAAARLAKPKETVELDAEYYGEPTPAYDTDSAQGKIDLAPDEVHEIPGAGVAVFTGPLSLDPVKVKEVIGGKVLVSLGVFSGRHSSPDNILDCTDIPDTPLAAMAAKPTHINCKLIAENP